jgi:hypothetical protein
MATHADASPKLARRPHPAAAAASARRRRRARDVGVDGHPAPSPTRGSHAPVFDRNDGQLAAYYRTAPSVRPFPAEEEVRLTAAPTYRPGPPTHTGPHKHGISPLLPHHGGGWASQRRDSDGRIPTARPGSSTRTRAEFRQESFRIFEHNQRWRWDRRAGQEDTPTRDSGGPATPTAPWTVRVGRWIGPSRGFATRDSDGRMLWVRWPMGGGERGRERERE